VNLYKHLKLYDAEQPTHGVRQVRKTTFTLLLLLRWCSMIF